ncbi:MAG TPA: methionine--tRNA ligase [Vicinamibacterales bacterium]|nr:methionine--tRNA ligase [Vicinamibacterales bacterium]
MSPSFYLTTAIDYVNSRPHLGTAYEKIAADVIARYKRLMGVETRFVMGNDEHSQNVFRKARELGLDPVAYCDRMEQEFRSTWDRLDISYDDFIRTTEPRHRAGVQELMRRCREAGDIYEGVYEGWYCVSCEAFKQEKDLVDGNCPVHLTKPDWIREKNYFFRLSKYTAPLRAHFEAHPEFLEPDVRRNEILRLLESGLEDISVSRAGQSWGIPVPWDEGSVVYVWFDALINYASAVGLGTDEAMFAKWWPADLHVIGKDITRFHCVIWPAMLMSAGLPVPKQVFGHGWVHTRGMKMSKSLGTVIDPLDASAKYGADPLRLYLTKEIAFGSDGDFTWERFEERYNVDLANNYGNLVSRIAAMADRYRQGTVTATGATEGQQAANTRHFVDEWRRAMESFELERAAGAAFRLIDSTNEFIAVHEPWKLAKDPEWSAALDQVLWDASEALRVATVMLTPFMPRSTAEILRRLGDGAPDARALEWRSAGSRVIEKGANLWPRIDTEEKTVENKDLKPEMVPGVTPGAGTHSPQQPAADAPPAPRITIDDFMKVDLRVAKVLAAERVPRSKKLIKLTLDLGFEQRTLAAGIAEAYEPEALVGRHVVIVANLEPRAIMGIESNGMVLAASPDGGQPTLIGFDVPPDLGSRVR